MQVEKDLFLTPLSIQYTNDSCQQDNNEGFSVCRPDCKMLRKNPERFVNFEGAKRCNYFCTPTRICYKSHSKDYSDY